MKNITDRQFELLEFLVSYSTENLRQPALYDIAEKFGISTEAVRGHMFALELKGWIIYSGQGPRNITITDEALRLVNERKTP